MSRGKKSQGKLKWVLATVLLVLVCFRLVLPYMVKTYINHTLAEIPGYLGHVEDVDIALWRGAYSATDVDFSILRGKDTAPLFKGKEIEVALDWRSLIHGRVVGQVRLEKPELIFDSAVPFPQGDEKAEKAKNNPETWQQDVAFLCPLKINHFLISGGIIRYIDNETKPKVNIYVQNIDLRAENLTNAVHSANQLPSTIVAEALIMKSGVLKLNAQLDPLSDPILADVKGNLNKLDLKELNDFVTAYGNFDFKNGVFEATLELAASKERYEGYLKTLLTEIRISDFEKERKRGDSGLKIAWQAVVAAFISIFSNAKKDQFAARIPISGTRDDLQIKKWDTAKSVLRNAFIKALSPDFENDVSFKDLVLRKSGDGK